MAELIPSRSRRGRAAKCPILEKWTRDVQTQHGLSRFEIEDLPNGDLIVPILVVPPAKRNQGVGTKVVTDLVQLADQNSRRIWLTPSKKSMAIGTTSKDRLVRFYKQFGFVENKGKHRDYSQRQGMYRDPGGGGAGGGAANYGSGYGFSVVGLPSMASEASVRRALYNAGVRDVYSEVTRDDDEVTVVIKDGRGNIQGKGHALQVFFEAGDKDLCVRALASLKLAEPRITNMWVVRGTHLERSLRSRGVGAILYRVLLDAASEAGGALVPDSCFKGGSTSKAAMAAWHRMRGPAWGPFRWNPALLPGKPGGRAARGRARQSLSSQPSQSLSSQPSQSLSSGKTSIDPVMRPEYNLREVYKQAILLEDHLTNPRKRCQDCISKHAHAVEALIEEACGLDTQGIHAELCAQLHADNRAVQRRLVAGDDPATVAQDVRAMRKKLNAFVRLRPV